MKMYRTLMPMMIAALLMLGACYSADRALAPMASKMAERSYAGSEGESYKRGSSVVALSKVLRSGNAYADESETVGKHLIYNSEISVSVENYKVAESSLKLTLESMKGYISETNAYTNSDGKLNGTISVRVPSSSFRAAILAIEKLGTVESIREWTEDVSEEYVDVQSRIANQKALEARLLTLLDHKGAKLKDLVAVEDKLAQIRTQIEQHEGRLRFLQNRISYSTLTITLFEPSSTQAAQNSVLAPLSWALNQVGMLFFGSIGVVIIGVVTIAPWLLLVYLLITIIRHNRRKRSKHLKETAKSHESGK